MRIFIASLFTLITAFAFSSAKAQDGPYLDHAGFEALIADLPREHQVALAVIEDVDPSLYEQLAAFFTVRTAEGWSQEDIAGALSDILQNQRNARILTMDDEQITSWVAARRDVFVSLGDEFDAYCLALGLGRDVSGFDTSALPGEHFSALEVVDRLVFAIPADGEPMPTLPKEAVDVIVLGSIIGLRNQVGPTAANDFVSYIAGSNTYTPVDGCQTYLAFFDALGSRAGPDEFHAYWRSNSAR